MQSENFYSTKSRIARGLKAYYVTDSIGEAHQYIDQNFAFDAAFTKSAIGNIGGGDTGVSGRDLVDWLTGIVKDSILGPMLPYMFRVEMNTPFMPAVALNANWIAESRPIPLSRSSQSLIRLEPRKVSALSVFSKEALTQDRTEEVFLAAQERAIRETIDSTFIDVIETGLDGEVPQSITSYAGVEKIASSGDPQSDIKALKRSFANLNSTFAVTDAETGAGLPLVTANGATLFPDAGARGGSISGIPLLTSQSSPRDSSGGQIVLVDASRIALALESLTVFRSYDADIQMFDEFDSDGNGETVNLFTTDSVAVRSTAYVNWRLLDTSAVRVLTGVDY